MWNNMHLQSVSISFDKGENHQVTIVIDRNGANSCSCFIYDGGNSHTQMMGISSGNLISALERCMHEHQYDSFYDASKIKRTYIADDQEQTNVSKITIMPNLEKHEWNVDVDVKEGECTEGSMLKTKTLHYPSEISIEEVLKCVLSKYN